jgi:hypothetical protein
MIYNSSIIDRITTRTTIMTDDSYSSSKPPTYIEEKFPESPTKTTADQPVINIVTPQKRDIRSFFPDTSSVSAASLSYVKVPEHMPNLTPQQNERTDAHFIQKNKEYKLKDPTRPPSPVAERIMTTYMHQCLEHEAIHQAKHREQQRVKANLVQKRKLEHRWKYSREHFNHPNPWNKVWAAHYATLHPLNKTPWLPKTKIPDTRKP